VRNRRLSVKVNIGDLNMGAVLFCYNSTRNTLWIVIIPFLELEEECRGRSRSWRRRRRGLKSRGRPRIRIR